MAQSIADSAPSEPMVDTDNDVIHFAHKGKASVLMGHAYVVTEFPLKEALCAAYGMQDYLQNIKENQTYSTFMAKWQLQKKIYPAVEDVKALMGALGIQSVQCARTKRSPFHFLIGGLAFGGTIFTQVQMANMRSRLTDLENNQNIIMKQIKTHETLIGKNTQSIRDLLEMTNDRFERMYTENMVTDAITNTVNVVNDLRHVVNMLKLERLDATLVQNNTLQVQLREINDEAKTKRTFVPNISPAAINAYPTSYEFDDENLLLYTQIPLLSEKVELDLYHFNQLPFKTADGWMEFQTDKPYLAVAKRPSGVFVAFSEAEIGRCQMVAGYFVCKHAPMLRKRDASLAGRDQERCLHAIWNSDTRAMKAFCSLARADSVERVASLGFNRFVIFTPVPIIIRVDCPDKTEQRFSIKHTAVVYLPAGCTADTHANYIWGLTDVVATTPNQVHILPVKAILEDIQAATKEEVQAMLNEGKTIARHLDETDLIRKQNEMWHEHIRSPPSIIAMVLGIFALLAVCFFVYRAYFSAKDKCVDFLRKKIDPIRTEEPGRQMDRLPPRIHPMYQPAGASAPANKIYPATDAAGHQA